MENDGDVLMFPKKIHEYLCGQANTQLYAEASWFPRDERNIHVLFCGKSEN